MCLSSSLQLFSHIHSKRCDLSSDRSHMKHEYFCLVLFKFLLTSTRRHAVRAMIQTAMGNESAYLALFNYSLILIQKARSCYEDQRYMNTVSHSTAECIYFMIAMRRPVVHTFVEGTSPMTYLPCLASLIFTC